MISGFLIKWVTHPAREVVGTSAGYGSIVVTRSRAVVDSKRHRNRIVGYEIPPERRSVAAPGTDTRHLLLDEDEEQPVLRIRRQPNEIQIGVEISSFPFGRVSFRYVFLRCISGSPRPGFDSGDGRDARHFRAYPPRVRVICDGAVPDRRHPSW